MCALSFNGFSSPKFGGGLDSSGALSFLVSDQSYKASLSYQQVYNLAGVDEDLQVLTIALDYKQLIQPKTFVTIGVRHQLINHKPLQDDDFDQNQNTALSLGLEYYLDKNIFIFGSSDLVSIAEIDDGIFDEKSALNFARIGIGYLF